MLNRHHWNLAELSWETRTFCDRYMDRDAPGPPHGMDPLRCAGCTVVKYNSVRGCRGALFERMP